MKLVGYLCVTATLAWLLLVYTPKAASDDNPPVTTTTVVTVPETYQGKGVRWWARHAVRARRDANLRRLVIVRLRARLARYEPHRGLASAHGSVSSVICAVFGSYCSQALSVARCESGLSIYARNGQYLGLFQEGEYARARYGFGWDAWTQARSAYAYFLDAGWAPWQCKP